MSLSEPTPDEQLAALSGSGDRPPVGPVSTYPTWLRALGLWVAAIATVVLAGSAVAYWQDARTSHRIQTSGVRTSAVVAAVHNHTVVSGPDREGNYTRTTSAILDVR